LAFAILLRAVADSASSDQARAWLDTSHFRQLCAWVDVPAARLRTLALEHPEQVRRRLKGWR
jgi:hypothetical protein